MMIELFGKATPPLDWAAYCALTPPKQLVWEQRGDELNQVMLYLMDSKNKNSKKDLHLAYLKEI